MPKVRRHRPMATLVSPKVVGNAFIEQYYHVLISRPGPDAEMTSTTTVQGINEKILSLNYDKYKAEIITADAQASYKGGLSVLVTGVLTGEDGARRMFTQSFFLAPQDRGYYVLNDMFRYVDGKSAASVSLVTSGDIAEAPEAPVTSEPEVSEKPVEENVPVEDVLSNGEGDTSSIENGKAPVASYLSPADSSTNDASYSAAVTPPAIQGDGSKKSFVNALRNDSAPFQIRASPLKAMEKPVAPAVEPEAPAQSVPNGNVTAEKIGSQAVKRHSFFVSNLPLDATPALLEAAFKRFGPIKHNGIQVRSSKEASIPIGNQRAHIEEQKNDGDKGRAPQAWGGFRNNNFRGRGGFSRGRGRFSTGRVFDRSRPSRVFDRSCYGRDFDRRFEFSSSNSHSEGGAFNRKYHNGSGSEGWEYYNGSGSEGWEYHNGSGYYNGSGRKGWEYHNGSGWEGWEDHSGSGLDGSE